MRILLLDIETAPLVAHAWGLWDQRIGLSQIISPGYTLCWAAKWLGEKDVMFSGLNESSNLAMLAKIHRLIDAADAVVHYNGTKFDMPTLNREFLTVGLKPPSPYKNIDLLQTARRQFKFHSNKLDYVAQTLGLGSKTKHKGHELWVQCMNNDPEGWKIMKEYNINDVVLLEKVYVSLLPWIKNHPNRNVFSDRGACCTNCGSQDYQRRGTYTTTTLQYHRYWCKKCGAWFRDHKAINSFKGFRNAG